MSIVILDFYLAFLANEVCAMPKADLNIVNPYIRLAIPSILPRGFEIRRRALFDYELIYVENGSFMLNYAEREFPCKTGQFLLLCPGVSHGFHDLATDVSQPHIHFDVIGTANSPRVPVSFKDISAFTAAEHCLLQPNLFDSYPQQPYVDFADRTAALALFYRILALSGTSNLLLQKALFLQLLSMLIKDNFPDCFDAHDESDYPAAQRIKDFIDAGQGVAATLDELAKQFSYSKYYLERQFKTTYGVSLIAYRNNKRMQLAREMLRADSVQAVAEKLGFSSIYVFSRAYKKQFGLCPSQDKSRKE